MSNYRDDRDALRDRVRSLEEEVETSHRELEEQRRVADGTRVAELEARMAEARRVIDGLQREVDAIRPQRRGPTLAYVIAGGAVTLVAGMGAFLVLVRSTPRPPPPPFESPAPVVVATAVTPPAAPTPAPRPRRSETARFGAKVRSSTGAAPGPGAKCSVEAKVAGDGDSLSVTALDVVCGSVALYRSSDPINGVSMSTTSVEEELGASSGVVYTALRWDDKGERTGARGQISLASAHRAATIWRDSVPTFKVALEIDAASAPVASPPLLDGTRLALRTGLVVGSTTGQAPVKKGASCNLVATPSSAKCPVRIACGSTVLYGETGSVAPCTLDDGRVATVNDPEVTKLDGDPALAVDVRGRHAKVSDGEGDAGWSVDLDFAK
jgi:hypothetical protein